MSQQTLAPWWRLAREAIDASDWLSAEGALRRLDSLVPEQTQVLDLLSYALLMQGEFDACETVLRRALAVGSCSFWTPHKLGDALRGQQRMEEAVLAYEQALSWGSDSPLTVRNLLQVLDGLDPGRALTRLEALARDHRDNIHWSSPPAWIAGACEAARNSIGMELADWLHNYGCPDPDIQQLALKAALWQLDLNGALPLARGALAMRLNSLLEGESSLQSP